MIGSWIVTLFSLVLFLCFQAQGIFTGDSGDLLTAAALGGIPHPPGYPLYTLLGWIFSYIPFLTVSWRITLLSSIPHAITVGLVYACIFHMTKKNYLASIFGSLIIVTNYLFFLYSTTPEVFALFDWFVIAIWLLLYLWSERKNYSYLYTAGFLYGLSLSHHHLMLFYIPAIVYFIWSHRTVFVDKRHKPFSYVMLGVWFFVGFLPYVYIPFAAARDSIVNWDRPVHWDGFIRLITRADYGTFVSGGSIGQSIRERMLAVSAYITFVRVDWTVVGIFFVAMGMYSWFREKRVWFWTWTIAVLCIGPLFFFYASFPLVNRFTLGTYERFLLPGYVFFSLAAGCGLAYIFDVFKKQTFLGVSTQKRTHIAILFCLTCMVYPLSMGGMTLWRFWGLPQDRTAENLGRDMLSSLPDNGVLLLGQDTPLFTTQYVRYVLGVRFDTAVIHMARLPYADYQIVLKKHFPTLVFPTVSQAVYTSTFIKENVSARKRVYSNVPAPIGDGWYWVPRGIFYEAMSSDMLPTAESMYQEALSAQSKMHNPLSGILARYKHLMLSDVLDVYADGHIALGKTLVRAEKWDEARVQFQKAVDYAGDASHVQALELLGVTHLYFKDCNAALAAFSEAQKTSYYISPTHIRLESMTYGECFGDEKRARELFSEYEKLQKSSEESLETL